uniref:Craniofacial development protein 2 n=1 Tax=Cacopsylla melanoneura TaxID=428564 RepID=A0A8D8R6E3_9HEMI
MESPVSANSSGSSPHSDIRVDTFMGLPCNKRRVESTETEIGRKKKKRKTQTLKIGTWNVRTMNREENLENLKREMDKQKINVMGLSEVRWRGEGEVISGEYKMIYKGGTKKEKGVGFIYEKCMDKNVVKVLVKSDRVIAIKFKTDPVDTLIIQVYMPTSKPGTDEEVEEVYKQIEEVIDENGRGQVRSIVMGDWNSVVGNESVSNIVGKYGLGKQNERGERLIGFCEASGLWISNTWFQHHKRRLYTYKNPGDRNRYQIDYILTNQRYKNSIINVKTYPGADVDSDHNLLAAELRTRLKHVKKKANCKKWNTEKLRSNEVEQYQSEIEEKLKDIISQDGVKEEWNVMKDTILDSLEKHIGKKTERTRKEWITQEMLDKMEERRMWKKDSTEEGRKQYKKLNNDLRRETDKAREKWMEEQCEKIEELEKYSKTEEMYKIVKNLTKRKPKPIAKQGMKKKDGILTSNVEENKEIWIEYIKELYDSQANDSMNDMENQDEATENGMGSRIEEWEVRKAIKELKFNKALGSDNIPSEALKALGPCAITRITQLMNQIYDTGIWPEDLLKTVLVPLPKKPNATQCKDFRTISFICHLTKAITRIIIKRIEGKVEKHLGEDQFGFRKGKGTRDAMGCMRMMGERMIDVDKNLYVCFIDWEKAFDRVEWNILLRVLKEIELNWKDRRLIRELYKGQKVVVRVEDEETEEITIGRGVRQGCCMSPSLFNLYAEKLLEEALRDTPGIQVGEEHVKNLKYADDQAVLAKSERALQDMIDNINEAGKRFGMKINAGKTKVMKIGKREGRIHLTLEGQELEQVENFRYLGGLIKSNGSCTEEIRSRIGMGKIAFEKVKDLLTARRTPLKLRKRFAKCYVWSVVLYGAETWTLFPDEVQVPCTPQGPLPLYLSPSQGY